VRPWALVFVFLATVQCAAEEVRPAAAPTPAVPRVEQRLPGTLRPAAVDGTAAPDEIGLATWYGKEFAGRRTSNGERFDPSALTAAHRKLPFGTWVDVRSVDTGKSVRVRITDRGPWGDARRVIDLSRAAADALDVTRIGVARVELRIVDGPEAPASVSPR